MLLALVLFAIKIIIFLNNKLHPFAIRFKGFSEFAELAKTPNVKQSARATNCIQIYAQITLLRICLFVAGNWRIAEFIATIIGILALVACTRFWANQLI